MTGGDGRKKKRGDVHEELDPAPLPKININTTLVTQILSSEASKGFSAKNVVCSPLSLEFALHMVGAGSKGNTLSQILQFIGSEEYPLHSMEDLNLKSSGIMRVASLFCKGDQKKRFRNSKKESELSFANGVWIDQQNKLKPSYKELMSSVYNARAETADFRNQADQIIGDINSWVAENTRGLIKQVLEKLGERVMIILVNALYFKGVWSSPFKETRTKDFDFHLLNGNKVSAPFMSKYDERHFFRAFDGFRVLELHYQSENDNRRQFSMQILLPDENDGLNDLLKKCVSDPKFLNQDFGLEVQKFDILQIPKFKFSYATEDVQNMMKGLGLTLPFSPTCKDLTEMVELGPGHSLKSRRYFTKQQL